MKNLILLLNFLFIAQVVPAQTGSLSYQIVNSQPVAKRLDKIAIDGSGNTILGGHFATTITFGTTILTNPSPYLGGIPPAVFITKMAADNTFLWAKGFVPINTSAGDSFVNIFGLTTDAAGNVYATGDFFNKASFAGTILNSSKSGPTDPLWDMFTVKITSSGTLAWIKQEGSPFRVCGAGASGKSVAVDNGGNVIAIGDQTASVIKNSSSCSSFCPNETNRAVAGVYVVKYSASGKKSWEMRYYNSSSSQNGPCTGHPHGQQITTDGTNYYITGFIYGAVSFGSVILNTGNESIGNVFIAKLNGSGQTVFAKAITGSHNLSYGVGEGQCFLVNNDIYVSGLFYANGTISSGNCSVSFDSLNNYLFKFNSSGDCQWDRTYKGIIYGAVRNPAGNISMLDRFGGSAGLMPFGIREISSTDGSTLDLVEYSQTATTPSLNFWSGPAKTSDGYVFCQNLNGTYDLGSLTITSSGNGDDFVLIHYSASAPPIAPFNMNFSGATTDEQRALKLYPNPVNDQLNVFIGKEIQAIRVVSLEGIEMKIRDVNSDHRLLDVSDLVPGIYFLMIQSDGAWIPGRFSKI